MHDGRSRSQVLLQSYNLQIIQTDILNSEAEGVRLWLFLFPKRSNNVDNLTDLAVGTAAEHLVCFDLILAGYTAFLTDQNCAYDIAVEVGSKLYRLQVKSTRNQRPTPQRTTHIPAYIWNVKRAGKGGKRLYAKNEFDLLALVALDIQRIAYMPAAQLCQSILIRPPGTKTGKQFDDYTFQKAIGDILK